MKTGFIHNRCLIILFGVILATACSAPARTPDLSGLYNELAQHEDPYRNPVILIPGMLGSKLIDADSQATTWGTFGLSTTNPNSPADGTLPQLTWAGSRYVEKLIMVGPPNAGSIDALRILVKGYKPALFLPTYSPAVIGTMPSIYQMLPRSRHRALLDDKGEVTADIYDPQLWIDNGWGLADHREITRDPAFTDNLLYILLESPRASMKTKL
jgi:hypothetical protein